MHWGHADVRYYRIDQVVSPTRYGVGTPLIVVSKEAAEAVAVVQIGGCSLL